MDWTPSEGQNRKVCDSYRNLVTVVTRLLATAEKKAFFKKSDKPAAPQQQLTKQKLWEGRKRPARKKGKFDQFSSEDLEPRFRILDQELNIP